MLAFFPLRMFTQEVEITSLEHALEIAKTSGLQTKQIQTKEQAARYDKQLAASGLMPSLSVQAQSDYNLKLPVQLIPAEIFGGQPGTFNEVRFGQDWNSNASGSLEVPLFHADKFAQMKAGSFTYQSAQADAKAQENAYLRQVTQVYLNTLVYKEAMELNRSLDTTATLLYETSKARFEQHLVGKPDLNRAENLMWSTMQQTASLNTVWQNSLRQLAALLGLGADVKLRVRDSLRNYALSTSDAPSVDGFKRPAILAAEQAEQASRWLYRQQMYASLPKISLNSRYTFANQQSALFNGNGTSFNYGTVGLSVSMPIFKGLSLQAQRKKAQLQSQNSRIQLEQTIIDSNREISEWQTALLEKKSSKTMASRRDQLAEETLDLSLANYDEGVISLDQLFTIYNEYVQAKNSYLQSIADASRYEMWLRLEN